MAVTPLSPIAQRAQRLWARCCSPQVPPALQQAWSEALADRPLRGFDDVLAAVQAADGETLVHDLIHCWRGAAITLGGARAAARPEQIQLVLALLLMAMERRAQTDPSAAAAVLAERLRHCDEPLAARLLAACLGGHGLLLEPASAGAGSEAANVMSDVEAVEYRHLGPRDVVRREVDATLGALRARSDQGESLLLRRQRVRAAQQHTRSAGAVRADLERFRRNENVNLMFVVAAGRAPQPLRDAEACRHAQQDLGIPVYLHGPDGAALPAQVDDAWSGLVADITEPFREALAALFAVPAAPAGDGPPQVFVSYSHDPDDEVLALAVFKALQALEQAGRLRVWRDARSIPPGAQFDPVIREGIAQSALALVLVSPTLLGSDYVMRHELPAIQATRPLLFFPFLLRACTPGVHPLFDGVSFKLGTAQALGDCGEADGERDRLLKRLSDELLTCLQGRGSHATA